MPPNSRWASFTQPWGLILLSIRRKYLPMDLFHAPLLIRSSLQCIGQL